MDKLDHWSYSSYNSVRPKIAETNANGAVPRYVYCDCGALLYVTNAWPRMEHSLVPPL
jgi:hypothetical protein